jgi:large subunit ribosomal protein L32
VAVPKRKTSKARRDKRRTHWKLKAPAMSTCSHCGGQKVPHKVCHVCGFYNGVEVFRPESF